MREGGREVGGVGGSERQRGRGGHGFTDRKKED